MARVSQPIQISEDDRIHLESMLEHADKTMTERIQIVLACGKEPSNKVVAGMLHTDEHKVAKWKEAFRKNGIPGLKTAGGAGRKPINVVPNLEQSILQLLEDEQQSWTIHSLATTIGTTDYQVSTVLQSMNIQLGRKRQWQYTTLDSCSSADVDMLGLYVTQQMCCAVLCYHPYGIKTKAGVFTTKNRELGEKLENAGEQLSVANVLAETQYYEKGEGTTTDLNRTIQDWVNYAVSIATQVEPSEAQFAFLLWSQEIFNLVDIFPSQISFIRCEKESDFIRQVHSWTGARTVAAHLYEIELVLESIETYQKAKVKNLESFSWRKEIVEVGTQDKPVSYVPWKEPDRQINLADWLQQLIKGELTDAEIQTGLIAFVRDKDGFSFRTIMSDSPSSGADQFRFDSEEGFLHGMNQLEKTILRLRDQAGLAATDLYLEQVKKNKDR